MFELIVARMKLQWLPASPEGQLVREPAELTWNRGGDVNTTEKVICSPWIHPSGIQQHKPNLPPPSAHHKPTHLPLLKEPMNARLQKQYGNSVSDENIGSTIYFFLICHVSCLS